MKRIHILIYGNVQGVFFRHNTNILANKLGLNGFVKNLDDGSVELVAEGDEAALEKLIEFCKKGPIAANVDDIKVSFEKSKDEFSGFEIRY